MKYKLKVYSIWEYGQRKDSQGNPHQEDSIFPKFGQQKDTDRTFILCDGMGGHDAGEVASSTVCEAMSQSIINDGHDAEGIFTDQDLQDAIEDAFDALDKKDTGAEKKMGTTLAFLKLHNAGATIAHMGDSRVYHIRPGQDGYSTQIVHVTSDHSLINYLIKSGELTQEESRQSKQKNIITKALQPNMDQRPKAEVYHTGDIKAGDFFYLCSDGMLEDPDMENGETLKNIFSEQGGPDERRVEILAKVTKDNNDNHTALIIHIQDVYDDSKSTISEKTFSEQKTVAQSKIIQRSSGKQGHSKQIVWLSILAVVIAAGIICFSYLCGHDSQKDDNVVSPVTNQATTTHSSKGITKSLQSIEEPSINPVVLEKSSNSDSI